LQPVPTNPAAVPDMAPPTRPRAGSPAGGANGGRPVPATPWPHQDGTHPSRAHSPHSPAAHARSNWHGPGVNRTSSHWLGRLRPGRPGSRQ
jgi:hypothetical protein